MKILEEKKGGVLILQPDSELMGGDETKQLLDRFNEAIREGTVNIILNMVDVKWMNSSGLGMIMAGLTTLRGSGGDLKLVQVSDRARRPIEITRLDQVIQLFETTDDAISSFGGGG